MTRTPAAVPPADGFTDTHAAQLPGFGPQLVPYPDENDVALETATAVVVVRDRLVSRAVKYAFDRVAALMLLLLTAPLLLIAGLAIWLEDRGPIIYRQERVGFRGEVFRVWKLRTMFTGADRFVDTLMADSLGQGRMLFKKRNDPRVTRVGRVLRRTAIDELPQLLNVMVGEMSLVGPRPLPGNDIGEYSYAARQRFQVRPGITGLWQVHGRAEGNWQDTISYDLRYVEGWSLWLDLKILLLTLPAVIGAPGGL